MPHLYTLLCALSAAASLTAIEAHTPTFRWQSPAAAPENTIVVFKELPDQAVLKSIGSEVMSFIGCHMVCGNYSQSLLQRMNDTGMLAYYEPDYRVQLFQAVPSPASSGGSNGTVAAPVVRTATQRVPGWGLDRIDQKGLPLDNRYTYPESGGAGVNVYVIDTGIDISNPEFEGRASFAINTIPGDTATVDNNGHGTFSAAIIAGKDYGVAKKANVIGVKSLGADGSALVSDVVRGLAYVVEQHQKSDNKKTVVNLSLGSPYSRATNQAVAQAVSVGITVVVASGNGDDNGNAQEACQFSPASSPVAITVGASDRSDRIASFSNYGSCVTLIAPGVDVVSEGDGGESGANPPVLTGAHKASGTSFAAPYVAGTVALMLAESGPLSPSEVKSRLISAASKNELSGAVSGTPNRLLSSSGLSFAAGAAVPSAKIHGLMTVCAMFATTAAWFAL